MTDDTPLPKQELLIKLMGMSTSANDAEALVAVRKANELLAANKWSWEKLIRGKLKVIEDPFKNIAQPTTHATPTASMYAPPPPRPKAPPPPVWTRPAPAPHSPFSQASQTQYAAPPSPKPARPKRPTPQPFRAPDPALQQHLGQLNQQAGRVASTPVDIFK